MRFIKKASINNIIELADVYKEIELHTTREDFTDENLNKIKKIYDEKGAIITAIHCPYSKYKTKLDGEKELSTNYMSWCEILGDEKEEKLFLSICEFAEEVANIYNEQKNDSLLGKDNNDDSEEDDNQTKNNDNKTKIIIVLHTGCIIGCCENTDYKCPYVSAEKGNKLENELLKNLLKFKNIEIAFENITPFYDGKEIGKNSGYGYENFILAEKLNKTVEEKKPNKANENAERSNKVVEKSETDKEDSNKKFGVVIDFCHIFATHSLLKKSEDWIDYFNKYMGEIKEDWIELIQLFHLSKYNANNNSHGGIFDDTDDDHKTIETIRNWCLCNSKTTPITLEVADSQNVKMGSENFFKIMLEWSKLHTEFKEKIEKELYLFFDDLYKLFSMRINAKTKNEAIKIALKMRSYVLDNQKSGNLLFDFEKNRQEKDIYLMQVQSYIYYMRYCNLAFDLIKKYSNDDNIKISTVLKHYMFNDKLEEVKFDGLGSYYNIYWIKNNVNLYRCYDGCEGGKSEEKNFKKIIRNCFSHIAGGFETTNFLSFSKTFGRVMAKYFNPDLAFNYNIEIVENATINCFYEENKPEPITIQEYQENETGYCNFAIDFSDFYIDRGDVGEEASLKELYEKVNDKNTPWYSSLIGSIYDQEVIMCNNKNIIISRYKLSALEFIIMMVSYSIILDWDNKKNVDKQSMVSDIVDKVLASQESIQNSIQDYFENKFEGNNVKDDSIKKILNTVDFEYERKNKIITSNGAFSVFAEAFIPFYKEIKQKEFYNNIIKEIKK